MAFDHKHEPQKGETAASLDWLKHCVTLAMEHGTTKFFIACGSFSPEVAGIDNAVEFPKTIGGAQ